MYLGHHPLTTYSNVILCLIAGISFLIGCDSQSRVPLRPGALGAGTVIGQTRILVFHDLGERGEFWATSEEWLTVPPPGTNRAGFEGAALSRRVRWVYWLFKPGDQAPEALFGADGTGFGEDGPIGSGTPSDQLIEAALPQNDEIVEVERHADGTYRVRLWKNETLGGWDLLAPDSSVLLENEEDKPARKAVITGSTATADLKVELQGPSDTKTFRFRSGDGRWFDVDHPNRTLGQ